MPTIPTFKELPLWQRSVRLAVEISSLATQLPQSERLSVVANMQDAALSIPVLLARSSKSGKISFRDACLMARLTIAEIETLLTVVQQLYDDAPTETLFNQASELDSALMAMARRLYQAPVERQKSSQKPPTDI